MKLFVSYSRDDKAWVYELWRALRDEAHHDAWIDRRIVPATDWWNTILGSIEESECFIYVLTPKSVNSIYCQAEFNYALALNKPILPLLLKSCDIPPAISRKRIQYQTITDEMSLDRVLFKIEQSLGEIRVAKIQGKYKENSISRPDVPKPEQDPDHLYEVFELAEEAAEQHDLEQAEKLFKQIIEVDPDGVGQAAQERLDELKREDARAKEYRHILGMAQNTKRHKAASALWSTFKRKYPDYDPNNLETQIGVKSQPSKTKKPNHDSYRDDVEDKSQTMFNTFDEVNKQLEEIIRGDNPPNSLREQSENVLRGDDYDTYQEDEEYFDDDDESYIDYDDIPSSKIEVTPDQPPLSPVAEIKPIDLLNKVKNILPAPFDWCKIPSGKVTLEKGGYVPAGGQTFDVPAFYIAKYPITNQQYAEYVKETGNKPSYWDNEKRNQLLQPVVGVTWFNAIEFCKWLSGKLDGEITLPTEQQWQRAAQGDDGRIYPWGNLFDKSRANTREGGIGKPTPITDYEGQGDSPFGVVDMSGNVWEWCLTDYKNGLNDIINNATYRVLRGGSWDDFIDNARADSRFNLGPDFGYGSYGFRLCAVPVGSVL